MTIPTQDAPPHARPPAGAEHDAGRAADGHRDAAARRAGLRLQRRPHRVEPGGGGRRRSARRRTRRSRERADRLAGALAGLGMRRGDRVGTFLWNTQEHLEAYLAVPAMGAVLHTLNLRLFPEQLAYVVDHGQRPGRGRGRQRPAAAGGGRGPHPDASSTSCWWARAATRQRLRRPAGQPVRRAARGRAGDVRLARAGRARAGGDVLHERHDRQPQGRGLQPPLDLAAQPGGRDRRTAAALSEHDTVLPVVPMFHANAWGLPVRRLVRRHRPRSCPAASCRPSRWRRRSPRCARRSPRAVPTIWNDLLALPTTRHRPVQPADGGLRRGGRARGADAGLPDRPRRPHRAGVGDDRDLAARRDGVRPAGGRRGRGVVLARARPAGSPPGSRSGSSTTRARCCRGTAGRSARSSAAGRGSPARTTSTPIRRSSPTAGCAPATSRSCTPTGSCRSPTAART